MNFLVIGDVVGRSGRTALKENLKKIQDQFKISFTIINAENSAGGYGLTGKIYEYLASRTPILAIGPAQGDAAKLLHNLKREPIIDYHQKHQI